MDQDNRRIHRPYNPGDPGGGFTPQQDIVRNRPTSLGGISSYKRGGEDEEIGLSSLGHPLISYSQSYKQGSQNKIATPTGGSIARGDAGVFVGSSSTVRVAPEVYSPLYQVANLHLPRDRRTMNAWNRAFYETNPYVRNAINLHAQYPISKLKLKCSDSKVLKFFEDMAEELNLDEVVRQVALEYWKLGEVFPYAQLNESTRTWDKIIIHNPDYIQVYKSVLAAEPAIYLQPDQVLKRVVTGRSPTEQRIRNQIPQHIIDLVRSNKNIPLGSLNVSHLKFLSSGYDARGISIIVSVYKDLMLYDKLRECYDEQTEVLTDDGFKKFNEVISFNESNDQIKNVKLKDGLKIACFNPDSEELEYHSPTNIHLSNYNGTMHHFDGKKIDTMVTPNHRMWAKKKKKNGWTDFDFVQAKDMSDAYYYKFRSHLKWKGEKPKTVEVCDKQIPTDIYMKFLGYLVSEGCIYSNNTGRHDKYISFVQLTQSKHYKQMRECINTFSSLLDKNYGNYINKVGSGHSKHCPKERWEGRFHGKDIVKYFTDEIGTDGKVGSYDKHIPRWVLELDSCYLKTLLDALVDGDGSRLKSKYGSGSIGYRYNTVSKQLADDVYEIAYKCGHVPNIHTIKRPDRNFTEYTVMWSDTEYGNEPLIYNNPNAGGAKINKVYYDGKVWCFEVPTGLFVTRRNGKITIQGNSKFAQADGLVNPITLVKVGDTDKNRPTPEDLEKFRQVFEEAQFDKDFKLVTHAAIQVERVGASGNIIDIASDMDLIVKNIYTGLMAPQSIIDTEGPTYASASVALEVLKARYDSFRSQISDWLIRKIFAPIAQEQGFWERKGGKKFLIVPSVVWTKMNLRDVNDYISQVSQVVMQGMFDDPSNPPFIGRMSYKALFDSLDIDFEEDVKNRREEARQLIILKKEIQSMNSMGLSELRSLPKDKPIPEIRDKWNFGGDMFGGSGGGDQEGMDQGDSGGIGDLGLPPGGDFGGGGGDLPPPAPEGEGGGTPPPGGEGGPPIV